MRWREGEAPMVKEKWRQSGKHETHFKWCYYKIINKINVLEGTFYLSFLSEERTLPVFTVSLLPICVLRLTRGGIRPSRSFLSVESVALTGVTGTFPWVLEVSRGRRLPGGWSHPNWGTGRKGIMPTFRELKFTHYGGWGSCAVRFRYR